MLKLFLTLIVIASIFVSVSAYSDHGKPPIQGIVNNFTELSRPAPASITPLLSRDQGQITLETYHGKFVLLNFCIICTFRRKHVFVDQICRKNIVKNRSVAN